MEIYKCADCQRKLNLADVSGVQLNNWRWFSWRNYFYQMGLSMHFLFILKLLNLI